MNILFKTSIYSFGVFLCGCSTTYSPPTEGPIATVQFSGVLNAPIGSGTLKAAGFSSFARISDLTSCKDDGFFANGLKSGESKAVLVRAEAPIVVRLFYGDWLTLSNCELFVQFVPEQGGRYSVSLDENRLANRQCAAKLVKRPPDGGRQTSVPYTSVCAAGRSSAGAPPSNRIAALEPLLEKQDYDLLLYRLFPQVSQGRFPPLSADEASQDNSWLRLKAEDGYVPLMYFLSWKLMALDLEESRKWNARARVGIMLDDKECSRDPRSPWYAIFEGRLVANNMIVRENDQIWYRAVDEALSWHASRIGLLPATWYCGKNAVLPKDSAAEARATHWKKIKEHNDTKLLSNQSKQSKGPPISRPVSSE